MKNKTFLVLMGTLLVMPIANAGFPDVSTSSPYYDGVEYVQNQGIVSGNPDGTYAPEATITRAAFTKIVVNAFTNPADTANCDMGMYGFPDVAESAWYASYVCQAKKIGLVGGYPDGTFQPGNNITLVEAAKIIAGTQDNTLVAGDPWYAPYIIYMDLVGALPVQLTALDMSLTRGLMAEMTYRVHANVSNKPSLTYDQLVTGNISTSDVDMDDETVDEFEDSLDDLDDFFDDEDIFDEEFEDELDDLEDWFF